MIKNFSLQINMRKTSVVWWCDVLHSIIYYLISIKKHNDFFFHLPTKNDGPPDDDVSDQHFIECYNIEFICFKSRQTWNK